MQTLYRNAMQSHALSTTQNINLQIGDRVELNIGDTDNECVGRVEYMGFVPTIKHEVIGVNLDCAIAEGHDGKGLFSCAPKHGLFTQKQLIKRVITHRLHDLHAANLKKRKCWQKLSKFPLKDTNFSIILDEHTLIAATWKDSQYTKHGLYKYDIIHNTWMKWLNYPSSTITSWHTMSLSPHKRCIYIFGTQMNLIKIDLRHNNLKTIHTLVDVGNLPNSIFIAGELHVIGGQNSNKHLVWNGKQKQFQIRYTFSEFGGFTGFILVHIESQDVLALIGGTSHKPFAILDSIYIYFIKQKVWIKYDYKLPLAMSNMSYVTANNGQYVLLIAPMINGLNGSRRTNRIYVVDTTNMNCKQSKIFLPFKPAPCHSICTYYNKYDNLLICGYLRSKIGANNIMYTDYSQIIIDYYIKKEEYLHVIQDFKPTHYHCRLSDILNGEFCSIRKL